MSLERVLREAPRFVSAWREHDVALEERPRARGDGALVFATDRSGGEYCVIESDAPEARGVWLHDSEGGRHRLAPDPAAFLERIARGFTVADQIAGRTTPSQRPLPGVLRWLATLPARE